MVAERSKFLREQKGFTQSNLAKKLNITRSSVNAWEMGISVPSTQCIIQLASLFSVSTDYLLGVEKASTIDIDGLSEKDIQIIYSLVAHLKSQNRLTRYMKPFIISHNI